MTFSTHATKEPNRILAIAEVSFAKIAHAVNKVTLYLYQKKKMELNTSFHKLANGCTMISTMNMTTGLEDRESTKRQRG